MAADTKAAPTIRHEDFCLPTGTRTEPRIESYVYLGEDEKTGRSRPTHDIERCLECGAANYKQRS